MPFNRGGPASGVDVITVIRPSKSVSNKGIEHGGRDGAINEVCSWDFFEWKNLHESGREVGYLFDFPKPADFKEVF
jgi:hypothetical protein